MHTRSLLFVALALVAAACSSGPVVVRSGGPTDLVDAGDGPAGVVWIIGDSITVGAQETLRSLIPEATIDAEVGRSFTQGIDRLSAMLDGADVPDVLVMALGTNNGATAEHIAELRALTDGVDRIVLVNVVVPRGWEDDTNATLRAAAAADDRFVVVDWQGAVSQARERVLRSDGYHPNEAGAALWAELVAEATD